MAAFVGVAWYARRASEKRAWDLDLDHLEPEINLDNDFNEYFEHELEQQSIGDIDSDPAVSLSAAAEKKVADIESVASLKNEAAKPQVSIKTGRSTLNVVIDDDIDAIEETASQPVSDSAEHSEYLEQEERIQPSPIETEPKPARKDSDDLVIALTIMAPENERLLIFARLPGPVNGLAMFDDLLETEQSLTEKLGGTLSDDTREPISESRLEAMRSRIFHLNFAIHNENNDYSN